MSNHRSPYPGLRPFTEEESIFFRGREEHIGQIIESLKAKKFIMITGASGDGKSSLVYAGLVPKAKAGFFKSTFKSWLVCDFRPEKSPFTNMVNNVSESLKLDKETVKEELSFGFSSLVDLYKSSEFYFDENSEEFQRLDADGRVNQRRKGANLLLIVDQFEEFFTNNENQEDGRPSNDSHLVANLLKSTVEQANEQGVPIYIVFTMRSDYIGNCAQLRGIPELLGYSQYFIPRLNRDEISDVIRDPANLNGDDIKARLVDQLVNSTSEGSDQLPIIQHCMNRIWRFAENSSLDLNHLAVCQGIKPTELPKEFQEQFSNSNESQEHWSLENVINHHASTLFDESITNFIEKYPDFTKEEVALCLESIFKGLVKIDDGKGVRYKCKVSELIGQLKKPLTLAQFNELIGLFRLSGNDLLAPYSNQIAILSADDSIEISHEALIRNWKALALWADEDLKNFKTFEDLKGQYIKWKENEESKDYLLPIGPLDYFGNWLDKNSPNAFWILKFAEYESNDSVAKSKEEALLAKIAVFIEKSREQIKALAAAKKRRRAIFLWLATAALVVLSCLTFWAIRESGISNQQRVIAETEKNKSEEARIAAQKAQEQALALSAKSDSLLVIAINKEQLANQATQEALIQKGLAEKSKAFALSQAQIAKNEAKKTLEALDQLLEQKNLTESQRDSAQMARNEAYTLSLKAISTSLALQATRFEIEPQVSALMVYHAQNFNSEINGDPYEAAIHSGSLSALKKLKGNNYNVISGANYFSNSTFIDHSGNTIYGICNEGELSKWTYNSGFFSGVTFENISEIELPNELQAINAFYLTEKLTAISFSNGQIEIYEKEGNGFKSTSLIGHGKFVTQIKLIDNQLISSANDGKVILWDYKTGTINRAIDLKQPITDFTLSNNQLYFISKNKIESIDINTKQVVSSLTLNARLRTCTSINNQIITSSDEGNIYLLNEKLQTQNSIKFSKVPIHKITISASGKFLAVASADKRIGIFRLNKLTADPLILDDINSQVRSLKFADDDFLVAGLESKDLKFWCVNPELIKEEICKNLQRQFSTEEWSKYIGDKVAYQQACNE